MRRRRNLSPLSVQPSHAGPRGHGAWHVLVGAGFAAALLLQGCSGCVSDPAGNGKDGGGGDPVGTGDGGGNPLDDGGDTNASPTATIQLPADGAEVRVGDTVRFEGSGDDAEDGALSGASLAWSSDQQGDLGNGAVVETALTALGAHVITLTATDAAGATGSAQVTVTVVDNLAPTVSITSPGDGASFAIGESVSFRCDASDPEDGPLPNTSIAWTSDVDGPLGFGANVVNALITVGTHTITCRAEDSQGAAAEASVTVSVVDNFAPEVTITSPADGSYFLSGTSIDFAATALDAEEGALTGGSLRWYDGSTQLGSGATLQTALLDGTHEIALEATDSLGAVGRATVTVHVVTNLPPMCTVSSPADGASLVEGETTTFAVTCTDPDGLAIPNASIQWTSDLEGPLGAGANVQNALTQVGTHVIEVCVPDTEDATVVGCTSITVTVVANQPPDVAVTEPVAGSFPACQPIRLTCEATDPEGRAVSYVWSSNVEGELGQTASLLFTPSVSGNQSLSCTATDAGGASASASVLVTVVSPSVEITSPADGDVFDPGTALTLAGAACDAEDGVLVGTSLAWESNIDGPLGTGSPLPGIVLSSGQHTITLRAIDSAMNESTAQISVWVSAPPTVTIDSPADGTVFDLGTAMTVDFAGTATDPEDGALTPTWSTPMFGDFATGSTASLPELLPGVYEVTLRATDASGLTSTDTITIEIQDGGPLFASPLPLAVRVSGIFPDANGNLWLATDGGGGVRYDPTGNTPPATFLPGASDLPDARIYDIAFLANGNLLVATDSGLAFDCDPTTMQCDTVLQDGDVQLQSDKITAVLVLPDGRVLIGTDQCMVLADFTTNQSLGFCQNQGGGDGLISRRITDFAYDAATGDVWIATEDGVSRMTPVAGPGVGDRDASTFVDYTTDEGLASNEVNRIRVAPSGDAWFATAGGLSRFAAATALITSYTQQDGLPSRNVRDVAIDVVTLQGVSHEVAWAATQGGLGRVDPAVPSVQAITTADGLPTNDLRSIYVDPATHMKWIGTGQGLVTYGGY